MRPQVRSCMRPTSSEFSLKFGLICARYLRIVPKLGLIWARNLRIVHKFGLIWARGVGNFPRSSVLYATTSSVLYAPELKFGLVWDRHSEFFFKFGLIWASSSVLYTGSVLYESVFYTPPPVVYFLGFMGFSKVYSFEATSDFSLSSYFLLSSS